MDTNTTREEETIKTIESINADGILVHNHPEFYMLVILAEIAVSVAIIADNMKGDSDENNPERM